MTKEKCVVLFGPTGHGKSSTANSFIGKKVFNTSLGTTSTTTDFNSHLVVLNEESILVVDTPDINDLMLGKSEDEIAEELFRHLPTNIDAFVFVFKFGNRCTKDEVAIISTLKKMYGDSFLDLVVIVFTFGDRFDKLKEDGKYNRSFDDWLQDHARGEIGSLLKKCGNRRMLYNNREQCEDKKQSQRNDLLNFITNLKSSGESSHSSCILQKNSISMENTRMTNARCINLPLPLAGLRTSLTKDLECRINLDPLTRLTNARCINLPLPLPGLRTSLTKDLECRINLDPLVSKLV